MENQEPLVTEAEEIVKKPFDRKAPRGKQNRDLDKREVKDLTKRQIREQLNQRLWEEASKKHPSVTAIQMARKVFLEDDEKKPKGYDAQILEQHYNEED